MLESKDEQAADVYPTPFGRSGSSSRFGGGRIGERPG
jgi:hypothetical protein